MWFTKTKILRLSEQGLTMVGLKKSVGIVFLTGLMSSAFGADLLDVYELARNNDATLGSETLAAQATAMERRIILSRAMPTVSLGAGYVERRTNKKVDSTSGEISLSLPLYTDALRPSLDIAETDVEIGELQLRKAQQNLYRRVVHAYFEILAAQDNLSTTTSQVDAISEFLNVTRNRSEVGLGSQTDVQNALARAALARTTEIRDRSAIETAWLLLIEITGERPTQLDGLKDDLALTQIVPNNVTQWVELATKNNYDLAIQQKIVDKARIGIRLAGAESGPNLNMSLSHREYGDRPSNNPEKALVSLSLSKSFSLGGYNRKLKEQAALRHKSQVRRLSAITQQIRSSVSSTYYSVVSLFNRIAALKEAQNASETALAATEAGYQVGTLTSLDVLNAQRDLYEVSRDLLRARYDYLKNSILLRELAGTLDLADLKVMNGYLD